ncbi:MAG: tripartite tricarboxylate transporter substrate binding protein [Hydrogenophaga sp.]|uniref:Bug family tripartite tricarboxylate transporter substrate binding protein n=1 Tax=Hydrogenophaga sp. TaxID=1904254 RepID=UPI0025BF2EDF|nr:tripartite tricarboxylate transporter substrate binding protein [Hydrogenophaga sp.]MBU7573497.1 tripartite tricarboxylate transporter substrate binding protein [Hydrogenophaga sp.]
MKNWFALACTAAMVMAAPHAAAQATDYPGTKPVRIVVPSAPGSGGDSAARFFGEQLGKQLGGSFVVENRSGAGGVIAANTTKSAPADGYTIFIGSNTPLVVTPLVMKNVSFDPIKDFTPLSGTTRGATMISVQPTSSIKTLQELVAKAKASPQPLNAGAFTSGYQLALEWFAHMAGIKINVVPYRDSAQMYTDVAGGRIDFVISDVVGGSAAVRGNLIRPLAMSAEKRHPDYPNVPTARESGYPDFVNYVWSSFVVRAETPAPIRKKLADALARIMDTDLARQYAKNNNTELLDLGPEEMRKFQLEEFERFSKVAKAAGITPQ